MAKVTCKGLTYAKFASGGDEAPVVYTGGKAKIDYLCNVDMGENRANVKEHADGHQIDSEQTMNEATCNLELANNDTDIKQDILGQIAGEATGELVVTDADAPFVGIGFILANRFKGTVTYEAYWYYKMQFVSAGLTTGTKTEQVEFQHETINGSGIGVKLAAGAPMRFQAHLDGCTSEADARAWLNAKAGIS